MIKQPVDFTPRERELIVLLAAGLTNKEIARHLFIGVQTVKNHMTGIHKKHDGLTTVAIVGDAIRYGKITELEIDEARARVLP